MKWRPGAPSLSPPAPLKPSDRITPELWAAQHTHEAARELGAPDLKEPSWYQLVGTDYQAPPAPSKEGQRVAARKARKAHRRKYPSHGPSSFLAEVQKAA